MCMVCVFMCVQVFTRMCFVCRLVLICGSGCVGVCGVFASMCAECRYACVVCLWVCVCCAHMRVCACACTSGLSHWPVAQVAEGSLPGSGGRLTRADEEAPRLDGLSLPRSARCSHSETPRLPPWVPVLLLCCLMSWLLWGLGEMPAPHLAAAGLSAETWPLGNTAGTEQLDGAAVPAAGPDPARCLRPPCTHLDRVLGLGPSGGPKDPGFRECTPLRRSGGRGSPACTERGSAPALFLVGWLAGWLS